MSIRWQATAGTIFAAAYVYVAVEAATNMPLRNSNIHGGLFAQAFTGIKPAMGLSVTLLSFLFGIYKAHGLNRKLGLALGPNATPRLILSPTPDTALSGLICLLSYIQNPALDRKPPDLFLP
jgi:hypothetical protein